MSYGGLPTLRHWSTWQVGDAAKPYYTCLLLTGKKFFQKKKQPIPVDLTVKDWAGQVRKATEATYMYHTGGTSLSIRQASASSPNTGLICASSADGSFQGLHPVASGVSDISHVIMMCDCGADHQEMPLAESLCQRHVHIRRPHEGKTLNKSCRFDVLVQGGQKLIHCNTECRECGGSD